ILFPGLWRGSIRRFGFLPTNGGGSLFLRISGSWRSDPLIRSGSAAILTSIRDPRTCWPSPLMPSPNLRSPRTSKSYPFGKRKTKAHSGAASSSLLSIGPKRELCFDDSGALVQEEYLGESFEYGNFRTYGEKMYPRTIRVFADDREVLDI